MAVELAEYRDLFFSEAHEQLASISAALLRFERDPGDGAAFQQAVRATHTLKGMAATMGFDEVTVLTHAFEDLLQSANNQHNRTSNTGIPPLLRTLDHLTDIIDRQDPAGSPEGGMREGPESRLSHASFQSTPSPFVRVNLDQLEELTALIVNLMASGNRLAGAENRERAGSTEFDWREHLALTKQLLATAWSLQMAPLGQVLNRFPRMLHDLAREERKDIRVRLEGGEIEIARAVLEEVAEILLHLVRNAVVHGVESVAERLAAGKCPRATVTLSACQHGDSLTLDVSDDGRGLDPGRILQAAHEQALISQDQLHTMGQAEAYDMIMLPGFSLSPAVTKVSGRGVGMDIVRKRVQALHGKTHISSKPGVGTTFSLELSRTNGALEVELVRVDKTILAIPAAQIESKEPLAEGDLVGHGPDEVYVSGRMVPLIDLYPLLNSAPRPAGDRCGLLIVRHGAAVAARVDEFLGRALWREPIDASAPPIPLFGLERLGTS